MCKYGPRCLVGYTFLATCKKSERQRDREMAGQKDVQISQDYHTALVILSFKKLENRLHIDEKTE